MSDNSGSVRSAKYSRVAKRGQTSHAQHHKHLQTPLSHSFHPTVSLIHSFLTPDTQTWQHVGLEEPSPPRLLHKPRECIVANSRGGKAHHTQRGGRPGGGSTQQPQSSELGNCTTLCGCVLFVEVSACLWSETHNVWLVVGEGVSKRHACGRDDKLQGVAARQQTHAQKRRQMNTCMPARMLTRTLSVCH